jgi:hypothetical protein
LQRHMALCCGRHLAAKMSKGATSRELNILFVGEIVASMCTRMCTNPLGKPT